ncbi:MAG: class I SAM-dependent methyltransferase, partial [Thermoanaerobaculia bacterium]|nr:class I SAM-dependent methyltransferase [Thermoanaerobaculia bacterium]
MMRTQPKPSCILCGAEGRTLYHGLRDELAGTPGQWSLKRCSQVACGLVWLDPAPVAEDLASAYREYYTHDRPSAPT